MKTLGQIAFEAYKRAKAGLTYDDKSIPPWEDLSSAVQDAWEAAAHSAARHDRELRARNEDPRQAHTADPRQAKPL